MKLSSKLTLGPVMPARSKRLLLRVPKVSELPGAFTASVASPAARVRRTPRAGHGACDHLRPGRFRARQAVCLGLPWLEPAHCARQNSATESLSTRGRFWGLLPLVSPSPNDHRSGFQSGSLPRTAMAPNHALQRTAPGVTAHASHRLRPQPPAPAHGPRRPPRSLSLGSLAVSSRSP